VQAGGVNRDLTFIVAVVGLGLLSILLIALAVFSLPG
jgi:hypothetical protein